VQFFKSVFNDQSVMHNSGKNEFQTVDDFQIQANLAQKLFFWYNYEIYSTQMDDFAFQKSLANLPKERRAEIWSHAMSMTEDKREQFLAELTHIGGQDGENMASEGEALSRMEELIVEAEHTVGNEEHLNRSASEAQEQDEQLGDITSRLDDA